MVCFLDISNWWVSSACLTTNKLNSYLEYREAKSPSWPSQNAPSKPIRAATTDVKDRNPITSLSLHVDWVISILTWSSFEVQHHDPELVQPCCADWLSLVTHSLSLLGLGSQSELVDTKPFESLFACNNFHRPCCECCNHLLCRHSPWLSLDRMCCGWPCSRCPGTKTLSCLRAS